MRLEQGAVNLKRILRPADKVEFQDYLLKHINESGDVRVESILRTKEDEFIVYDQGQGRVYCQDIL